MDGVSLTPSELIGLATEKVNLGRQLMGHLKDIAKIEGISKIQQQIGREVNNLLIAINEGSISLKLINASKLLHLECLVKILLKCRCLTSVDYVLPVEESDTEPMRVDIVCENGACSVNVEAKNLHTLSNSLNEAASIGHKRILNQAEEFVEAATMTSEVPKPPQVCLIFDNELDTGNAKVMDDNCLMDFVNSIVRMDQTEFHLNNASQSVVAVVEEDAKSRDQREFKRMQIQQRRSNPIIRTIEIDRKRIRKQEKRPEDELEEVPRKYVKTGVVVMQQQQQQPATTTTTSTVQLINPQKTNLIDHHHHHGDFKTDQEEGIYELVRTEDEDETVIYEERDEDDTEDIVEEEDLEEEQPLQETTSYSESQSYFCDSCKETGNAYEQEILRLREELSRKETLIKTLRNMLGPPSSQQGSKVIVGRTGT